MSVILSDFICTKGLYLASKVMCYLDVDTKHGVLALRAGHWSNGKGGWLLVPMFVLPF